MPGTQQTKLWAQIRAKYQQMDPWVSACPPSSLVFIAQAQPQRAWWSGVRRSSEATPRLV